VIAMYIRRTRRLHVVNLRRRLERVIRRRRELLEERYKELLKRIGVYEVYMRIKEKIDNVEEMYGKMFEPYIIDYVRIREFVRRLPEKWFSQRSIARWRVEYTYRPLLRPLQLMNYRVVGVATVNVNVVRDVAEDAYRYLTYNNAPFKATLCTHEYCRSSRIYIRWTPDKRGVSIYYAYTIVRDYDGRIAFPTTNPESQSLAITNVLRRKMFGDVYTSTIELIRNIQDLTKDRVIVVKRDDNEPRVTVPAFVATYFHHRVLAIRAKAMGYREAVDSTLHCSVYYQPNIRPQRSPRDYYFTDICVGRFCIRRIRIRSVKLRRW